MRAKSVIEIGEKCFKKDIVNYHKSTEIIKRWTNKSNPTSDMGIKKRKKKYILEKIWKEPVKTKQI